MGIKVLHKVRQRILIIIRLMNLIKKKNCIRSWFVSQGAARACLLKVRKFKIIHLLNLKLTILNNTCLQFKDRFMIGLKTSKKISLFDIYHNIVYL